MEIWVYALCVIPNIFCEFYRSYLAKHNCFIEFALEKFNYMKVGRMNRKAFKSAQVKKGVQFFDIYFVEDLFFFFRPLVTPFVTIFGFNFNLVQELMFVLSFPNKYMWV